MRILRIVEIPKYFDQSELKEINEYKKNNRNNNDEKLSFSDILKKEKEKRN